MQFLGDILIRALDIHFFPEINGLAELIQNFFVSKLEKFSGFS